ncbi:MAG: hypothetical protein AMJ77_06585 [Dehalococcoidia bacterium SM23_28_2]|nr:MAG: hypothetical protein AMJ77_06585 [Dehalococcoidia bacterium SM23_28_2]
MHNRIRKLALWSLTGMLALGLVTAVCAIGIDSSQAQQGAMQNCPQAGKWAISVWSGDDGADAEQAFATCDDAEVAVAYSIDPETQAWSRWFADRPAISTLTVLNDMQGLLALGASEFPVTPTPTPSPLPPPTPTPTPTPTPGPGVNLVPNPSFETGTEEPDGWTHEDPSSSWDTTVSHTGSKSVHATGEFTECPYPWWQGWVTTEPIFIDTTSTYVASAWVMLADTIDAPSAWYATIQVNYFDASGLGLGAHGQGFGPGAPEGPDVPLGVWTRVSMGLGPAAYPPDTAYVQVELGGPFVDTCELGGSATTWFDDVYFASSPP